MKPDASPIVSKLTLLVLTLILACLVVLVYRSFQGPPVETPLARIETAPAPVEENIPRATTPPPAPVIKRTLPAVAPPVPTNSPAPAKAIAPVQAESSVQESTVAGRVSFGPTDHHPAVVHETLAANGSALLAGMVTLKGTPKPEIPIELGPTCAALQPERVTTRHFVVGPKGELANVVVHIKSGLQRKFGPVQPGPLIDQVGCMFEPYVSAVVAGQTFQIRNSDPTLHNLHFTPKAHGNREFNIGQGARGQVNTFSVPLPEMFGRIKCDVHPWMFTYISVFDHPYFAVTDTNGFFQLPAQIPAGKYTIVASHLKLGAELQTDIRLREGEQRSIQFEFEAPNSSEPTKRVARSN